MTRLPILMAGLLLATFLAAIPGASAAPTGTCGAGGGIWSSIDTVCSTPSGGCALWLWVPPVVDLPGTWGHCII